MNLGTDPLSRQLKLVKNLCDAYIFLNADNIKPFISRDYKFHTFPKIADLQDEAKERHLERYAVFSSLMTKIKVCTQPPSSSQAEIHHFQVTVRDEVEVLRKVTLAVCPSIQIHHTTSDHNMQRRT